MILELNKKCEESIKKAREESLRLLEPLKTFNVVEKDFENLRESLAVIFKALFLGSKYLRYTPQVVSEVMMSFENIEFFSKEHTQSDIKSFFMKILSKIN